MTSAAPPDLRRPEVRGTASSCRGPAARRLVGRVTATGTCSPARHRRSPSRSSSSSVRSSASRLPGDREAAPLGAAGASAYALLATFGGRRPRRRTSGRSSRRGAGLVPRRAAARDRRRARHAWTRSRAGSSPPPSPAICSARSTTAAELDRWPSRSAGSSRRDHGVAIVVAPGSSTPSVSAFVRADRDRAPFGRRCATSCASVLAPGLRRSPRPACSSRWRPRSWPGGRSRSSASPAAHPVLLPPLLGDPGDLPADHPLPVAGHRARRLHRDRARPAGQRALPWRSGASWACRRTSCSTWSTPR